MVLKYDDWVAFFGEKLEDSEGDAYDVWCLADLYNLSLNPLDESQISIWEKILSITFRDTKQNCYHQFSQFEASYHICGRCDMISFHPHLIKLPQQRHKL